MPQRLVDAINRRAFQQSPKCPQTTLREFGTQNTSLARAHSIRDRSFGNSQHRRDPIRVADIEQHSLRQHSTHLARFQIHDEKRLSSLNFARVRAFFFDPSHNRPRVIAEVDAQLHKVVGVRDFTD